MQIQLPDTDAQVKIESYAAGRLVKSVIAPDNSEHLATIQCIVQGQHGTWQTSRVTHAPSVIIRSGELNLSFHHGAMIANDITEAGQPRQFECALSDDEFAEVREAVGKILEESAEPEPHN